MPNDSGGSFPMPPQDDKFDSTPLTDPVAPILSEPEVPASPPPPQLSIIEEKPEVVDTKPYEAPVQPTDPTPKPVSLTQPPAELKPATPPPASKPPVVTLLLIFIAIGAVALTSFFYIQSQKLNSQLNTLSKTLDNQKTTPTPTPTVVITPTYVVTPTVTVTPIATPTASDAATPTAIMMNTGIWSDISTVISTVTGTYPKAQLLMVDAQYVQPGNELVVKYWFRQDETTKKYAYVLKDNSKDLSLVDQQVYLTPDNNIPSLNKAAADKSLGIEFDKAITIAKAACPTSFDCATANVSGKFIRTNSTLWQITFKQADKVFVVQIDSLTEKVLYKSQ